MPDNCIRARLLPLDESPAAENGGLSSALSVNPQGNRSKSIELWNYATIALNVLPPEARTFGHDVPVIVADFLLEAFTKEKAQTFNGFIH